MFDGFLKKLNFNKIEKNCITCKHSEFDMKYEDDKMYIKHFCKLNNRKIALVDGYMCYDVCDDFELDKLFGD